MTTELEEMLAHELHEVARGVHVPPMPRVGPEQESRPRSGHVWQPLLVAAAVVLIVGIVALVLNEQGGGRPQPAPAPSITPTTNGSAVPGPGQGSAIPVTAPTVPYVLDQHLHVGGTRVPGTWWSVESRHGVWLGQQSDGSWWWGGPGVDAGRIAAQFDQPPVLSPNGRYVAFIDVTGGTAHLTGFDTRPTGEGFGQAPVDLPRTEGGVPLAVRAVTDDGDVIVQGTRTSVMWRAQWQDQQTVVDLGGTAPDQVVLQGTPAGLVVVDGSGGAVDATETAPYLADVSGDGRLTDLQSLPTYDVLDVSPGGSWLVRSPAGTLGGEVASVGSLDAQPVQGGDTVRLAAPKDWAFAVNGWAWEDDETLVSVVVPGDGSQGPGRLVRCSVTLGSCRSIADAPTTVSSSNASGTAKAGGYTAERALDDVVRAVVAGDRGSLADQDVIASGEWDQLVGFAAGQGGSGSTCRDNGSGTKDCEIVFDAARSTTYYAILEPAQNAYGWRISYVGVGGA